MRNRLKCWTPDLVELGIPPFSAPLLLKFPREMGQNGIPGQLLLRLAPFLLQWYSLLKCRLFTGACFFIFLGRNVYSLGWTPLRDHPPPKPPFQCPHQTKKGTILLLSEFTWNYNAAELWDKNWDTDAHAHVTYQAPIIGLHSFTLLLFLQDSTNYLMLAQSCSLGLVPASLAWLITPRPAPSACASDF